MIPNVEHCDKEGCRLSEVFSSPKIETKLRVHGIVLEIVLPDSWCATKNKRWWGLVYFWNARKATKMHKSGIRKRSYSLGNINIFLAQIKNWAERHDGGISRCSQEVVFRGPWDCIIIRGHWGCCQSWLLYNPHQPSMLQAHSQDVQWCCFLHVNLGQWRQNSLPSMSNKQKGFHANKSITYFKSLTH